MRRLLVDTSAYSMAMRGRPQAVGPTRLAEFLAVTPVVLGELLAGFRQGNREQSNRTELQRFLASPRVHLMQISEGTAEYYAGLLAALSHQGTRIPTNDIWIAASAVEFGLTLLTADRHFLSCPLLTVCLLEQDPPSPSTEHAEIE